MIEDLHSPAEPDLIGLLIHDREAADAALADPRRSLALLPRFVALSLGALVAFAVVQGGLLALHGQPLLPQGEVLGPALAIPAVAAACIGGFFGAQVASLPSAYFYALLAGLRVHGWRIALESMRSQATASIVLLGLLPVYAAVALGSVLAVPESWTSSALLWLVGYPLPFVAGLAGVWNMTRSFLALTREAQPAGARRPMPVLLVLAWSVLFTALAPMGVLRILYVLGS